MLKSFRKLRSALPVTALVAASSASTPGIAAEPTDDDSSAMHSTAARPAVLTTDVTSLSATGLTAQFAVRIRWATDAELNTTGFRVLRSSSMKGPFLPCDEVIPGLGTSRDGRSYEFVDLAGAVEAAWYGQEIYYAIEAIDASGAMTRFGPVKAVWLDGLDSKKRAATDAPAGEAVTDDRVSTSSRHLKTSARNLVAAPPALSSGPVVKLAPHATTSTLQNASTPSARQRLTAAQRARAIWRSLHR